MYVDIWACLGYLIVADIVLLLVAPASIPVNALVAFPLLVFVPGYTLLAALFPSRDGAGGSNDAGIIPADGSPPGSASSITGFERGALSVGLSLGLLPILGTGLSETGVGIERVPLLASLTALVVLTSSIAVVRRHRLPSGERFDPELRGRVEAFVSAGTVVDSALAIGLLVVLLVSTVSLGLGLTVPNGGDRYTELTIMSQNESGDLVLGNYPRNFTAGQPENLTLRVTNQEGEPMSYWVVVQVQQVTTSANSTTVQERQTVTRLFQRVPAGEQWQAEHTITPQLTGTDLRVVYYLYRTEPPDQPDGESAYRQVQFWITVTG